MINKKIAACVCAENGLIKQKAEHDESVELRGVAPYEQGDYVSISTKTWPIALRISLDKTRPAADIWLTSDHMEFPIPFGNEREAYPPNAFEGENREICVELIPVEEWNKQRNLSENPWDKRGETAYYPHCRANVETRDESVFAARNTIDGVVENTCHGEWPYQSWGDAEHLDAEIEIVFGRRVSVDKAVIHLRADFPHDNYWKEAVFVFSDGSEEVINLQKMKEAQEFHFTPREVEWVKLKNMVRGEEESPFPALTQWAFYGKNIL